MKIGKTWTASIIAFSLGVVLTLVIDNHLDKRTNSGLASPEVLTEIYADFMNELDRGFGLEIAREPGGSLNAVASGTVSKFDPLKEEVLRHVIYTLDFDLKITKKRVLFSRPGPKNKKSLKRQEIAKAFLDQRMATWVPQEVRFVRSVVDFDKSELFAYIIIIAPEASQTLRTYISSFDESGLFVVSSVSGRGH